MCTCLVSVCKIVINIILNYVCNYGKVINACSNAKIVQTYNNIKRINVNGKNTKCMKCDEIIEKCNNDEIVVVCFRSMH